MRKTRGTAMMRGGGAAAVVAGARAAGPWRGGAAPVAGYVGADRVRPEGRPAGWLQEERQEGVRVQDGDWSSSLCCTVMR